jgi:DNA-directed RNA polymerase specialized sigma24 family protein
MRAESLPRGCSPSPAANALTVTAPHPRVTDEAIPELLDDADPSELIARREEGRNLWQFARRRLGENQFQALWLHYAEDFDVARIAQVMGKTRVHVKVLLFRGRQILGRDLNPGRLSSPSHSDVELESGAVSFGQPAGPSSAG